MDDSANPLKRPWLEMCAIYWTALSLSGALIRYCAVSVFAAILIAQCLVLLTGPLIFGKKSVDGSERGYVLKSFAIIDASIAIITSYFITKGEFRHADEGNLVWVFVALNWLFALIAFIFGERISRKFR